ncbi:MAG: ISAs1 family transposase [Desulfobulbus sp.]|jgi:predicted transposase YbfD/YdcC|nr:ISAs1 family transposase [Desulfobulbus sp.]
MKTQQPDIASHFESLKDPRVEGKNQHLLIDIIIIAICAVVSGASGWEQIEIFGKAKQEWLSTFLELPNGMPGHDTFRRVISRLNSKIFQECFLSWVHSLVKVVDGEVIPIDGKTLRRSYDTGSGKTAIHMVSAWAAENRLVLGQVKTEEKSNEITAIPELLKLLEIKGCIVTIDAMGCQKKIAAQIIQQGGDYVLGLKGNQGSLLEAVETVFSQADVATFNSETFDFYQMENKGHGRHEIRSYYTTDAAELPMLSQWKGLRTIGVVVSERTEKNKKSTECRYYISSQENKAELFAKAVRSHWGIENSLHYVLDVTFREDECRIRKGDAPENFAVLRHIARNLLQREKTKMSIKQKQFRAACNNAFLANVLAG